MPNLLLVDDDQRLAGMVSDYLGQVGYAVETAASLSQARACLARRTPEVLLLDLMLPDGDGLEFTAELRRDRKNRQLPILMLTARGEPTDRVIGLEMGADDYLGKPFEPRELLARVKALLRRAQAASLDEALIRLGELELDTGARRATLKGRSVELTGHQFDILLVLARHAGRVMSRDQIMDALKGHPLDAFDRSIDVHVSRIRAAIEEDPRDPKRLLTVRGVGYILARPSHGFPSEAGSN